MQAAASRLSRMIRLPQFVLLTAAMLTALSAGVSSSVMCAAELQAAEIEETPRPELTLGPVSGALVICGGGELPSEIEETFLELAGGDRAQIVVIPTATRFDVDDRLVESLQQRYAGRIQRVDLVHTRSREVADSEDFSRCLDEATAVWISGGNQNLLAEVYVGTRTEQRMHAVLQRGGVIAGTSAGAAIMSRVMIAGGRGAVPRLGTGLGFLPGTVVDQHFAERNRFDRLRSAVMASPGHVGLGVDEGTALVVQGRGVRVIGRSGVAVYLPKAGRQHPERWERLKAGETSDLFTLRREAVTRAQDEALGDQPRLPDVKRGTLVLVGQGETPTHVVDRFLTAAGGKDAPIVVVSSASEAQFPDADEVCHKLLAAGAANVQQLKTSHLNNAPDAPWQAMLAEARGVWLTGGQPARLLDACLDTPVQQLFQQVLARGGVIGGSSDCAALQGEYLLTQASPEEREVNAEAASVTSNDQSISKPCERGFAFLPGVTIDRQFGQDTTDGESTRWQTRFPQLVAIGVADDTALVVHGTTAEVIGSHEVTVIDRRNDAVTGSTPPHVLRSGDRYDFRTQQRVSRAEQIEPRALDSFSAETLPPETRPLETPSGETLQLAEDTSEPTR